MEKYEAILGSKKLSPCNIHDNSFIAIPILVKHRISTEYIKAGHSVGFEHIGL
jgi:hypothetical protein